MTISILLGPWERVQSWAATVHQWWTAVDKAADLARIGHRLMESLPQKITPASVGALQRWELAHPGSRWDHVGIYHQPVTTVERWLL